MSHRFRLQSSVENSLCSILNHMVGKSGTTSNPRGSRRQKVVEAAYDVIASKGFEGLRLRDVAARAGIDHSTLHHHFPHKSDLIEAVLEHATEQFRPPPRPGTTAPIPLGDHLDFLGQMIIKLPELHSVLREFDLHGTRDRRVKGMILKSEKGWRERLAARIQVAKESGDWPADADAVIGAELVIAVVKGASLNSKAAVEILRLFADIVKQPSTKTGRKKKRP